MLEPLEVEIRTLHAILGSDRDPDGRAFAPLADAYRRSGNPRKAFGLLKEGLARLPDFTTGHVVAARFYMEQGLTQEGELAARRALALDPGNVSAMATLAGALLATDRASEAMEWLVSLDDLEPDVLDEHGLDRPAPRQVDDDEEVWDIALLAPDAPATDGDVEEEVWDIAALAPDGWTEAADLAGPAEDDEVLDIALLAPDEVVEDEAPAGVVGDEGSHGVDGAEVEAAEVVEVEAIVVEETEVEAVAVHVTEVEAVEVAPVSSAEDVAESEPEAAVVPDTVAAAAPSAPEATAVPELPARAAARTDAGAGSAPRIYTRTLGELYARQGFVDRAVEVFRQLHADQPDDGAIATRLEELEAELSGRRPGPAATAAESGAPSTKPQGSEVPAPAVQAATPAPTRSRDEELEALARDLVGHAERQPDIDTPFAWTEDVDAEADASPTEPGPSIGTYFDDLLRWRPGERS